MSDGPPLRVATALGSLDSSTAATNAVAHNMARSVRSLLVHLSGGGSEDRGLVLAHRDPDVERGGGIDG